MKLCNEKQLIKDKLNEWENKLINHHREDAKQFRTLLGEEDMSLANKLKTLNSDTTTKEELELVLGHEIRPYCCDECDHNGFDIVMMGQEPDYESRTAYLCLSCLKKAINLLEVND